MLVDRQTADDLTRTYRCPMCKARSALVAAWNGQAGLYEVKCGV